MTEQRDFVWCGNERCEARDGLNSDASFRQYFSLGQVDFSGGTGTSYYFDKDHLGSIREMTNSSGSIVWQQSFDPYGVPTNIVTTTAADFGYAGYYVHQRSGLNLTRTRAYNASLGRFISRDPAGEFAGHTAADWMPNPFTDAAGIPDSLFDSTGIDVPYSISATDKPDTAMLYGYAGNDPIDLTDPLGLFWNPFKGHKRVTVPPTTPLPERR